MSEKVFYCILLFSFRYPRVIPSQQRAFFGNEMSFSIRIFSLRIEYDVWSERRKEFHWKIRRFEWYVSQIWVELFPMSFFSLHLSTHFKWNSFGCIAYCPKGSGSSVVSLDLDLGYFDWATGGEKVGLVGLEPTISPLWAVRFNQLNYKPLRSSISFFIQ